MKHIRQIKCEVQSFCQNDCEMCAHGDQRKAFPEYQLSLEDLHNFLNATQKSGYYIDNLRIHGPGEPLLWKFFNQGVQMIKESDVVGTIFVATNGIFLKNISDTAWDCIDEMRVSIYESFNHYKILEHVQNKFHTKIKINRVGKNRIV